MAGCGDTDSALTSPSDEQARAPAPSFKEVALREFASGNISVALMAANKAVEVDAGDPQLLNLRGVIHQQMGDHNAAISDFSQAITLDATAAEYFANRGLSYRATGDWLSAESDLKRAVELPPALGTAHYNLAVFYYDTGFPELALPLLERAADLNPEDSDIWFELGLALDQQGSSEAAISAFSRAIELDKGFDDKSFLLRGVLYAELGEDALAEQDFDAALNRGLRDADTHFYRGLMRYRRNDLLGARSDFAEAVNIDPDFAEGWYHLSFAEAALGNQEAAREHAQRALELDPPEPDDSPD